MTLASQMTTDVVQVFLNTEDFAQVVTHYANGDESSGASMTVIWFPDALEGSNENEGDGRVLHRDTGDKIRQSGLLEVANTESVTELKDTFLINSELWALKRIIGKDANMMTLLVVKTDKIKTRRQRRRG